MTCEWGLQTFFSPWYGKVKEDDGKLVNDRRAKEKMARSGRTVAPWLIAGRSRVQANVNVYVLLNPEKYLQAHPYVRVVTRIFFFSLRAFFVVLSCSHCCVPSRTNRLPPHMIYCHQCRTPNNNSEQIDTYMCPSVFVLARSACGKISIFLLWNRAFFLRTVDWWLFDLL